MTSIANLKNPCTECQIRESRNKKKPGLCGACHQKKRKEDAPECTIESCKIPQYNRGEGLCSYHNTQRLNEGKTCNGEGGECGRAVFMVGLCCSHYLDYHSGLGIDRKIREIGLYDNETCRGQNGECGRRIDVVGLCRSHYEDLRDGLGIDREIRDRRAYSEEDICEHPDCMETPISWGVCKKHRSWWERENRPDEYRATRARGRSVRRAREYGAVDDGHSDEDVIRLYGEFCYLGGERVAENGRPLDNFHKEHVIPYFHGGDNTLENVRPSCQHHNNKKSSKRLTKYLAHREPTPNPSAEDIAEYIEMCRDLDSRIYCVGTVAEFKAQLEDLELELAS